MRRSQTLIATTISTGFALLGSIVTPAAAQQAAEPAFEEIIVTAQKREETLLEVPMSVTVLSGALLERQKIDNFADLVSLVPGFSINTNTRGVTRVTLRGINTGGVASTVGVYVDDVPFGSSSGLANAAVLSGDFDSFDLDRIEILRGPQGTVYGASSLAGVMKYVTEPPSTEGFAGNARATLESVDGGETGYAFSGLINVPFSDVFAVRAGGFYRQDGGYLDTIGINPIASLTDPNANAVDGTRVDDDINGVDTFGGRVTALFQPSDRFSLSLMALTQNIDSDSGNFFDADPDTLEPINDQVKSQYQLDPTDITYNVYSANLDWDFGPASLQSITSYATFEEDFTVDVAANSAFGAPLAAIATLSFGDPVARPLSAIQQQVTSTDKFTQEFRLVSADSDRFDWLIGLYYTDEDSGIDPQQFFAVESGTDTVASGIPVMLEASILSSYEEIAAFANATWHITPRFDLSFGARQSDNEQNASQVLSGALLGTTINFDNATSSESPFTWSVSPRFALGDNASLYARVATGFRPGGPNVIPPGAPPGTPGSYDSDELTNYEIGIKAEVADGRFGFDVAAYFLDWKDIQLLAVVNNVGLNANGGTAESKGFEFAADWRPFDGFSIAFNGSYVDAYLTQDTDPIIGGMDGDPLSYVPEWSYGIDGNYEWTVFGDALAYVGANVGYTGDRPANFGTRDADGNIREADAYTTLNLRAGVDFEQWTIELYGKNLTDAEGISDYIDVGTLPNGAMGIAYIRPPTVGLSVGVNF